MEICYEKEKNYKKTDWETSKKMLNKGEIGCMVLGAWAYPQIQKAGENGKIQNLVESAHKKDNSFDEIMEEWNQKWSDAQKENNIITE